MENELLGVMKFARMTVEFSMEGQDLNTGKSVPLKKGDTILILIDDGTDPIVWKSYFIAFQEKGIEPIVMIMNRRDHDYADPPEMVVNAMELADGIMYLTSTGIVHSKTGQKMSRLKKKNFHGEKVTVDIMTRGWRWFEKENIKEWTNINNALRNITSGGKTVRVTNPKGTDITIPIGDRKPMGTPGSSAFLFKVCNLVPSECHLGIPNINVANGKIAADLGVHYIGGLKNPIIFTVKKGKITEIDGGTEAIEFQNWIEAYGDENARNLCEIAVGTNKLARITGNIREDIKVWGTCHIGFGQNVDVGGTNQSNLHFDTLIGNPTVTVDNTIIVENGKIII